MSTITGKPNTSKKIALASTPWPLYNRPSIQLGALKAYLRSRHPGLHVDARHFYLKLAESLGYKLYQQISERTWLAELLAGFTTVAERQVDVVTMKGHAARAWQWTGRLEARAS